MKKLGKKLSFLTKIMLVAGLLISNLSSLSVVFASESTIGIEIVDEKLNIKYLEELANEVETVRVDVYENYTYLDETFYVDSITNENQIVSSYDLTEEELDMLVSTEEDKVLLLDSILSDIVFDGTYDVKVEIIDTSDESNEEGILIDTCNYSIPVLHDGGLNISVIDANTNDLVEVLEDGRYSVDYTNSKVNVVAKLLAGGLNPTDMFMYDGIEYMAEEMLDLSFTDEMDFTGRLFGDYTLPLVLELSKLNYETNEYELMEFSDEELNVNLLYGTYELDALAMNTATLELGLDGSYKFNSTTKDGVVYVLLDETKVNTMLDLYSIVSYMFAEDDYITYLLSNSEYDDVLATYDEATATVSLEEYLASIVLDDTVILSLINEGLTVTYKVVVAGDTNNDNKLTEEDLLDLINQVVGEKEVDVEKSDLYGEDKEVNTLDVMYLDQVIKNKDWNTIINNEEDASIDAELKVAHEDIISGQKFTVNYIVKLSDYMINGVGGLFTYDSDALELNSVETSNEWLGNSKDGKFLFVGDESLALPEISEPVEDVVDSENSEVEQEENNDVVVEEENNDIVVGEEETVETLDYVVVSATFTAKKAGTYTVSVENCEYFNQDIYYGVEETPVSVSVVVNASDNNNLSSLTVAGKTITLVEGQLDYEITVGNDVTVAEVNAMVENVAANITSIVSPEELVEGENSVIITVTAESGDVKIYTVKVIREAAPEEETTTQVNNNYYNDYDDEDESEEEIVVTEPEEDDEDEVEKEESNLSRIVIIILILLVIAGLIYLIFKDEDEDKEEAKKVNKEINKLKKEEKELEIKKEVKSNNKTNNRTNTNNKTNNTRNTKNKKN